jgi:uncharacterized protein YecT (DUF1311 family)
MCEFRSSRLLKLASQWIVIRPILVALLGASAMGCGDGKAEIASTATTGHAPAQSAARSAQAADPPDQTSGRQSSGKSSARAETSGGDPKAREIVPEIVIAPGFERLSYLSPKLVGIRPEYRQCLSKQGHEEDCAEEEWRFQDARMNAAYRSLLSKSAPPKKAGDPEFISRVSAIAAQRAWVDFMNANCAAKALRLGSSRGPATQRVCEMQMTAYRAQELEDWSFSVGRQLSTRP